MAERKKSVSKVNIRQANPSGTDGDPVPVNLQLGTATEKSEDSKRWLWGKEVGPINTTVTAV